MQSLGKRIEHRVVHTAHRGGWVLQQHANAIVCRAARTVRRSTIVLMLVVLGAALITAAWVIANLALHSWLVRVGSVASANLTIAGLNLLVGAVALVVASVLSAVPPVPVPVGLPRRLRRRSLAPRISHPIEVVPPPSASAYAEPTPTAQESELTNALGASIELGILAARTHPRSSASSAAADPSPPRPFRPASAPSCIVLQTQRDCPVSPRLRFAASACARLWCARVTQRPHLTRPLRDPRRKTDPVPPPKRWHRACCFFWHLRRGSSGWAAPELWRVPWHDTTRHDMPRRAATRRKAWRDPCP
jgi:hypothetical protein